MGEAGKVLGPGRFSDGKRSDPRSDLEKSSHPARPFVKWVGGKSQLLKAIEESLPQDFASRRGVTYIEPFAGGGAALFWMLRRFPNISRAVISDINADLMAAYRIVRDAPSALIAGLRALSAAYLPLNDDERRAFYLGKRARYNSGAPDAAERAALLVFLNRTCFNGLYRVNRQGKFNVPFGRYAAPTICDEATIAADSALLQKAEILCGDFSAVLSYAAPRSLFYLDPPYKPLGGTSSFTSYDRRAFDDGEQERLAAFCRQLDALGHEFILSNSDLKGKDPSDGFFDKLYAGFKIRRVLASRMVNADAAKRGKLTELMITNIGAKDAEGASHE